MKGRYIRRHGKKLHTREDTHGRGIPLLRKIVHNYRGNVHMKRQYRVEYTTIHNLEGDIP